MKNLLILAGFAGLISLISCEEHEVIPPPVPIVDLKCACDAVINDSVVQYTDTCRYFTTKAINTGALSNAQYKTFIQKNNLVQGMKLEIRSIEWSDDGSNTPTIAQWKTFFDNNLHPGYSTIAADNGVVLTWTDPNNRQWISDSSTICFKNFAFNSMVQDSDTTGDYMLFDATFNCVLRNSDYGVIDSAKCLENGHIKSAFRLE